MFKASQLRQDTLPTHCLTPKRYMADIKLESQETDLISQDSLLRSISPLQEHKSGVSQPLVPRSFAIAHLSV